MGDTEASLGLDGLKVNPDGGGRASQSYSSTRSSTRGSVQVEVKLPWYMGITFKV